MNLHKRQLYLLEQHSESFGQQLLGLTLRGKSSIMKLGQGLIKCRIALYTLNATDTMVYLITTFE